ncbi:MAG: hypothetical protein QW733_03895 [Desulfurococcaceae archaeon]
MRNYKLGAKLVYKEKDLGDDVLISGLRDFVEFSDAFFIDAFVNSERRGFKIESGMELVRGIFLLRETSKSNFVDWSVLAEKKTDELDNAIDWINKALSLARRSYEVKLSYFDHTKGVNCSIIGISDDVVFLDITNANTHIIVDMLLGKFKERLQTLDGLAKDYIQRLIEVSTHIGQAVRKYLKKNREGVLFRIEKDLRIEVLASYTCKEREIEKAVSDILKNEPIFDTQTFLQKYSAEYLRGISL